MKKTFSYLITFLLMGMFSGLTQEDPNPTFYNNISMPETPTGASLGKYGEIPVNMATGVPQINVPIFSFDVDGLEIPISLSYHASGVKVNDLSTAVGLNWTLNAGGGIFRSVNGLPDEDGWVTQFGPIPNSFYNNFNSPFEFNYYSAMLGGVNGNGLAATRDHNPDDYHYNFLGHSGKFITDFYNNTIKNIADELQIDFDYSNSVVKDQQGNSFYFEGVKEHSYRKYASFNTRIPDTIGHGDLLGAEMEYGHPTGWLLSKITTRNNKEVSFDYEEYWIEEDTNGNNFTVSSSITFGYDCRMPSLGGGVVAPFASLTRTVGFVADPYINGYNVQLLTKITSDQYYINFQYSTDANLSVWQRKLDKILVEDRNSGHTKEFNLIYGTFDGDARLQLQRIFEKKGSEELPGYSFYYKNGQLPPRYSFSQDFFGYHNGKNNTNSLAPKDPEIRNLFLTAGFVNFYDNNTSDRAHSLGPMQIGVLEEMVYPTGGWSKFYYEANAEYNPYISKVQYCGGLRVKKIEHIDPTDGVVNTLTYHYQGLEGQSYETHKHYTQTMEGSPYDIGGKWTFHSGFVANKTINNTGYFYKEVTETQIGDQENLKRKFTFTENFSYTTLGHLLESEIIFKGNDTIKIVEYDYGSFGIPKTIHWNILGDHTCGNEPDVLNKVVSSYQFGYHQQSTGDMGMFPTRIATTDFVYPNKITTLKEIDYDHTTLLKLQEVTDTRHVRIGRHQYAMQNPFGERIQTDYYYPTVPYPEGFPIDFPKGLVIKQETTTHKGGTSIQTAGRAFAFDDYGNIKTVYGFSQGQGSNNSSLSYVPGTYEELTSFIYSDGYPVQVKPKKGTPTSYIWNKKSNTLVAKIEGRPISGINSGLVTQLENATYGQLPSLLSQLRTSLLGQSHPPFVTTYTYKPLAGVATITDPKNQIITYQYDAFGRLESVKDLEGNLVEEYEYNYSNN